MTPSARAETEALTGRIPAPSPADETWRQAFIGCVATLRARARWLGWLAAEAVLAVVRPLLTAAVDGLCILVVLMTVWELWHPVEAIADAVLASYR